MTQILDGMVKLNLDQDLLSDEDLNKPWEEIFPKANKQLYSEYPDFNKCDESGWING